MEYFVTFARYGFVTVDADSEEEAWEQAKAYSESEISWSDDYDVTDVQTSE